MKTNKLRPDHILDYFRMEWFVLLLVTVSGLIYNFGLLAGPWFEGKLAECLLNVLRGSAGIDAMLKLVLGYVIAIAVVQISRYIKRFYVRRFANNVNREMKKILYANMIHMTKAQLEQEGAGSIMTKAISDVDDCVEGMRKFTTEIFDTGVAMIAYIGMLLYYDWRLALLCMIFPPISYVLAERMKKVVQKTGADFKIRSGNLSSATLDRVCNAITYRVFGCEKERSEAYEQKLKDYERSAVRSNIWSAALPPLYQVISMLSVLFILYFGSRNVLHCGWTVWTIAAFTTFLSCFAKLAVKSSKAAKLFNSVHKAQVSWKRIHPFLRTVEPETVPEEPVPGSLVVRNLGFSYPDGSTIFEGLSFSAVPGQIIGITGPVACGKSTLGRAFLCEAPYDGSIQYGGRELSGMPKALQRGLIGYLGHDPELQDISIRDNLLLGRNENPAPYLRMTALEHEVSEMPEGLDSLVGSGGVLLSGGQGQRLALARTLLHKKPVMILDDPFSALDHTTEAVIFAHLRTYAWDSIVLLISHRLYLFPELDQVIWMENGTATAGTHEGLMRENPHYAELFHAQGGGLQHEA